MKTISLRTKTVLLVTISLALCVIFSIVVSYLFYSDAIGMNANSNESTKTQFFLIFSCAEILVALIIILLAVFFVENYIIKPIRSISGVVASMVYDNETGKENYNSEESKKQLKNLDIHTGDEIEELYHSLQKMQMDMNEYIIGMREENWEEEHDSMTMLSNKAKFEKRKKEIYPFVDCIYIACLDIVNLKIVNQIISTEAGDSIITKVARELRRLSCDTIHTYRMEEDHFVIVCCGYIEEEAIAIVSKWIKRVGRLNRNTDNFECKLVLGGSAGDKDFSVDEVLKRADAELYCKKLLVKQELDAAKK